MKKLLLVLVLLTSTCAFAQDKIITRSSSVIEAKVIEIGNDFIKYKRFSNQDGPVYSIPKKDITTIWYENGEEETFENSNLSTPSVPQEPVEESLILKSGTEIPIQIVTPIKAADVQKGQTIPFKVNKDISINGVTVIPFGTAVKGTVYEAKKSSWWGTKGRLGIKIDNISLPEGGNIPLNNGNVYVTGTNRTALSVLLFLFITIPACGICGSKAQIPPGYEIVANVAETLTLKKVNGIIFPEVKAPSYSSPETNHQEPSLPHRGTIVKTNSIVIDAIIESVSNDVVTYKKASKPNGKTYTIPKNMVGRIDYK